MLFLSVPESIRALLSFRRVDSMIFSDSDIYGFIVILGAFGKLRSLCQLDEMLLASDERASLTRISWVRSILYLPSLTHAVTDCLLGKLRTQGFYSLTNGSNIIADSTVLGSTCHV